MAPRPAVNEDDLPEDLRGLSEQEFAERLYTNGPNYSPQQLQSIAEYADEQGWDDAKAQADQYAVATAEPGSEQDPISDPFAEEREDQQEIDVAENVATAELAAQQVYEDNPGAQIPADALAEFLPPDMQAGTPEANQWLLDRAEAGRQAAIDAETDQLDSEGGDHQENVATAENKYGQSFITDPNTPTWILQMFSEAGVALTSGTLPPEYQDRFLDYYNDLMGTTYTRFDVLAQEALQEPDQFNQMIAQSVVLSTEPIVAHDIELPGRDPYRLSQGEAEAFAEAGFQLDAVTGLIRRAHAFTGIDPATGQDRRVDTAGLAMMARYFGWGESLTTEQQREQRIAELRRQISEHRSGPGAARIDPLVRELDKLLRQQQGSTEGLSYWQQREQAAQGRTGGLEQFFPTDSVGGQLAKQVEYNRGLDTYGQNQTLAFIHTVDSGLAARIARSGGDPEKLSLSDSAAATEMLMDAGVINRSSTWAGQLGLRSGDNVLRQFSDFFAAGGGGGGGGGGAGPTRRIVDAMAVTEQVNRLWQAMFRAEADPNVVAAFTQNLQAQLDAAPDGMEFDVSSRIQAFLKGEGIYDELYGKKPAGVTEEEWQGQFAAAQASILGDELTEDTGITEGMRQGDYQTTVGAAAGSKQAWGNSRWLERLARAGQVVAENT